LAVLIEAAFVDAAFVAAAALLLAALGVEVLELLPHAATSNDTPISDATAVARDFIFRVAIMLLPVIDYVCCRCLAVTERDPAGAKSFRGHADRSLTITGRPGPPTVEVRRCVP
jgi:hypothetical protein